MAELAFEPRSSGLLMLPNLMKSCLTAVFAARLSHSHRVGSHALSSLP